MKIKTIISENYVRAVLLLNSFMSLFFLPILLYKITLENYGNYLLIIAAASFLHSFINPGFFNIITAFSFKWLNKKIFTIRVLTYYILILFLAIITYIFLNIFSSFFDFKSLIGVKNIEVVVLFSTSQLTQLFCLNIFRMLNKLKKYADATLFYVLIDFFIKTYYLFNYEFSEIIFVIIISAILLIFYTSLFAYEIFISKISFDKIILPPKSELLYGLNFFISNLIGKFSAYFDKPLINGIVSIEEFAIYALARRIIGSFATVRTTLKSLWIYHGIKSYNSLKFTGLTRKHLLNPFYLISFIGISITPIYITYFLNDIPLVIYQYLMFLFPIELIWMIFYLLSIGIAVKKDSRYVALIQFLSLLVYLIAIFFLLKFEIFGVIASLYITLISTIIFYYVLYKKLLNINIKLFKELLIITLILLFINLFTQNLWQSI